MAAEYGVGLSQHDFMVKDECLVINYNDEVVGSDNKYNVHKFISGQPKGAVHRAFSVMLFDGKGRLLLQQRAPPGGDACEADERGGAWDGAQWEELPDERVGWSDELLDDAARDWRRSVEPVFVLRRR